MAAEENVRVADAAEGVVAGSGSDSVATVCVNASGNGVESGAAGCGVAVGGEGAASENGVEAAQPSVAAVAVGVVAGSGGSAESEAATVAGTDEDASESAAEAIADEDIDPEAAAEARELAEHNALADVFDDVRRMSADSQLVTPDRWPVIGLVPDHMTDEDFEMFVYEWLEDFQAEHAEEIAAEIAAEKAKAAAVRSATHAVGVPPKIPNRRLAQIEADEKAKAAAVVAGAGSDAEADTASGDFGSDSVSADGEAGEPENAVERADVSAASLSQAAGTDVIDTAADAAGATGQETASTGSAAKPANDEDDSSPFAGLKIPEGYRLEQIEGEWVLVEDEDAAPVRKEISCNRIKVLMGMHSYYLYDQTLMTDNYARWAFLAAEDNPQVTFVECVREDSRVYPRPYAAECLRNPPFSMTDEQIQQTWEAVRDSGNYPDIRRTVASNGDVYYYSTDYLDATYAESLAEYDAVERPANV